MNRTMILAVTADDYGMGAAGWAQEANRIARQAGYGVESVTVIDVEGLDHAATGERVQAALNPPQAAEAVTVDGVTLSERELALLRQFRAGS